MTDPMEPEATPVEPEPVPAERRRAGEILAAQVNGEREGLPLYDNDSLLEWGEDPDEQIQGDIHVGDEDESGDDLAEEDVEDDWLDDEGDDDDEEEDADADGTSEEDSGEDQ
jgi:hypothetical protein